MENKKNEVRNDLNDKQEEEEEEEMEIEKFCSLLRSFRDARDRLRRRESELHDQLEKYESNKKKMKTEPPCFELQDFTTDIQFRKLPLNFLNPVANYTIVDNNKVEKKEHTLDLKLAL